MPSPHNNSKLYLILRKAILPHLTAPLQNSNWYLASHPTPWPTLEEGLVCAPLFRKLRLPLCPLPHHFYES